MDFPQVQAVLNDIFPDAEQSSRALQMLLPELSKFGCSGDAEAWGFLGNIAPSKIAEMSGLDLLASQLLKDRAKQQQQQNTPGLAAAVEVIPADVAGRFRYLLSKEGFEVCFAFIVQKKSRVTLWFSMSKISAQVVSAQFCFATTLD